ncbi:unnamed protein product, partial [Chrysoparadoxa australica]
YSKKEGTHTVHYPWSGLENATDKTLSTAAKSHNSQVKKLYKQTLGKDPNLSGLLEDNLKAGLNGLTGSAATTTTVIDMVRLSLHTPDYARFSNTVTARAANENSMSLERSHNNVHLLVGGMDSHVFPNMTPWKEESESDKTVVGQLPCATGDMGENDTAACDPIFFLHHCNIDRLFWIWQNLHGQTEKLKVDPSSTLPGLYRYSLAQGITPGLSMSEHLSIDTPLYLLTKK